MSDPLLVSAALLGCFVAEVAANLGWMPTATGDVPVYDAVFGIVAPLGIFWLLLGAWAGLAALGPEAFSELRSALGGMFVGTYTGGSANFNAIALEYDMQSRPVLFAAANAVDASATALWMGITLVLPRLFAKRERKVLEQDGAHPDAEQLSPLSMAVTLALGLVALAASQQLAVAFDLPMILVLTTIALVLAQLPFAKHLAGTRALGMLAVLVFLAVIGALCDVEALRASGPLVVDLAVFVGVLLLVHGQVLFGGGRLLGGGTSALAVARSLGRRDLVLSAVLVGSVGTAAGTYLGLWAAERLF